MIIIGVLLAVLVPLGFATDDGPQGAGGETAPVATIARRVQALRGLRFDRLPRPVRVSAAQAKREGLADLDRGYPAGRRRADEALYTLLGLLPPGASLKSISASVFGDQVAGYYDPVSKDLRIVEGAGTANRVLDEMVIAHELTHALDDQAIGIDVGATDGTDDAPSAYQALVEGVATEVMYDYLDRFFARDVAFGGLLGGAFAGTGTGDLPPFVVAGLTFPYVTGQAFVGDLLRRAGGRWTLVDLAERSRPPVSTEQVMHPEKWIRVEVPDDPPLRGLGARLGPAYRRLTGGTFGEWQTQQWLARAGGNRAAAAAGWGGDRYELWRRGGEAACATPCVERDVLVLRWRWDTGRDLAEFVPAASDALSDGLGARAAGGGVWSLRGGSAVLRTAGRDVTLAFAPDRATALTAAG
jgi:hypothetical protein